MTPLTSAVCYYKPAHVKILIENGANVNQVDGFGDTAFSMAKEKGHIHILELLQSY
jgi:ankyrin repeat protein